LSDHTQAHGTCIDVGEQQKLSQYYLNHECTHLHHAAAQIVSCCMLSIDRCSSEKDTLCCSTLYISHLQVTLLCHSITLSCVNIQGDDADALSSDPEAAQANRTAMESALAGPSAAHPVEGYGSDNLSLAKVHSILTPILHAYVISKIIS